MICVMAYFKAQLFCTRRVPIFSNGEFLNEVFANNVIDGRGFDPDIILHLFPLKGECAFAKEDAI